MNPIKEGKVRQIYDNGDSLILVASDRISCFDVILNNPKKLEKIKGLTKKQVNTLQDSLRNYQGSYEDILKLTKLGFNTSDSMKIYNYYKNRIKDVLDNNLYNIYYDIEEISFSKVDAIYTINYPKDSVNRIAAAIIYIIKTFVIGNNSDKK